MPPSKNDFSGIKNNKLASITKYRVRKPSQLVQYRWLLFKQFVSKEVST